VDERHLSLYSFGRENLSDTRNAKRARSKHRLIRGCRVHPMSNLQRNRTCGRPAPCHVRSAHHSVHCLTSTCVSVDECAGLMSSTQTIPTCVGVD
jgi:hypothetical protein